MALVETCHYCAAPATTQDHIWPRSKNGPDAAWNKVPACSSCNSAKSDREPTCRCIRCRAAIARVQAILNGTPRTAADRQKFEAYLASLNPAITRPRRRRK